jgi:hypothetical protein
VRTEKLTRARSSVGRAPPSHGGGHEFESRRVHSLFLTILQVKRNQGKGMVTLCGVLLTPTRHQRVLRLSDRSGVRETLLDTHKRPSQGTRAPRSCCLRERPQRGSAGDAEVPYDNPDDGHLPTRATGHAGKPAAPQDGSYVRPMTPVTSGGLPWEA